MYNGMSATKRNADTARVSAGVHQISFVYTGHFMKKKEVYTG